MEHKSKSKGGGGSRGSSPTRPQNLPPSPARPLEEQKIAAPVNPEDPVQGGSEEIDPDYGSLLSEASGLCIHDEAGVNKPEDAVQESSEQPKLEKRDEDEKRASEQERRKIIEAQVREARILQEKMAPLQKIWGALKSKSKKKFLSISIAELRDHLTRSYSTSDHFDLLVNTFDEAVSYGKANNGSWKVWLCPDCDQLSTSCEMLENHLMEKHSKGPFHQYNDYYLLMEWLDIVRKCRWEPVDNLLAVDTIKALGRNCSVEDIKNQKWPFIRDPELTRLLQKIRGMFMKLIVEQRCLTTTNLATAMKYATETLEVHLSEPRLQHLIPKMARVHIPICLLSVHRLEFLLDFLRELSAACDSLEELPDKDGSFDRALNEAAKMEVKDSIVFNQKKTGLLLDETLLTTHQDNSKAFIEWLFDGTDVTSIWEQWLQLKDDKIRLLSMYFMACEKTSELLKPLFDDRDDFGKLREEISSLRNRCEAEPEMRREARCDKRISYLCLLKKREYEINRNPTGVRGHELYAIKDVLKAFASDQLDLATMTLNNDELLQKDHEVMLYLTEFMTRVVSAWNQLDAKIAKTFSVMNMLSFRFKSLSGLDYRAILLPIIKSFLKEKMKKLAREDGTAATSTASA